ncbi:MAG: hypothetical protein CMM58_11190 [Rhodospirillaceae bacterium]|nr:hypothetical protein [Rhodospirillaceae bacterium]
MQSYQLFIKIPNDVQLQIGKLGLFEFPAGIYAYTGSGRSNIDARIARHLSTDKKRQQWHIDYLLTCNQNEVINVVKSQVYECDLNAQTKGKIVVRGFGSSDCLKRCGSHLKLICPR